MRIAGREGLRLTKRMKGGRSEKERETHTQWQEKHLTQNTDKELTRHRLPSWAFPPEVASSKGQEGQSVHGGAMPYPRLQAWLARSQPGFPRRAGRCQGSKWRQRTNVGKFHTVASARPWLLLVPPGRGLPRSPAGRRGRGRRPSLPCQPSSSCLYVRFGR
jgi:hypothetical protein